jgi:hypothetical protein
MYQNKNLIIFCSCLKKKKKKDNMTEISTKKYVCLQDMEEHALQLLPSAISNYIEGG